MSDKAEPAAGFVGRAAELGVLRTLAEGVAAGLGGVAWVEGEPGIGKSALVAEALRGATAAGCTVFWGAADELRRRFPLGVMADCLGVNGSAQGERGEIGRLLRGEAAGGGMVPAGDVVAAAAERVLALVDRLCGVSPVVLVVDDLQWADELTVSVWHRLAGGVGQVPLLVVGMARPVPPSPGLEVARRGMAERRAVVSLRPMPEAEVELLLTGLAGGRPGPALLAQARQAGGNPLYVRELTDALLREERVRVERGAAELAGAGGGAPVSLAAAIEGRLGFVSGRTLEVLRAAALLGARFSVRDLEVVSRLGIWELAEVVREAVAAGVLVEAGEELAFRHGLIQQALEGAMPAGLRSELHREVGRALAGAGAGAERVAAQLLSAGKGMEEWALGWLADNAAELVRRAPQAAAELLQRAAGEVPAGDPRREVLAEYLAGVLVLLARYDEAEPVARDLLASSADPNRRAQVACTLAYLLTRFGRCVEALEVIRPALAAPDPASPWTARLGVARGMALRLQGRDAEAADAAGQALAVAERTGNQLACADALRLQATLCNDRGDGNGALALVERALGAIGDDPEGTDLRLLLLSNRAAALYVQDADVSGAMGELVTLAERAGTARVGMARCLAAEWHFNSGRWDDALAELAAILDPGTKLEPRVRVTGLGTAALIAASRDDSSSLSAYLRTADAQFGTARVEQERAVSLRRARAGAAERDGRPADAVVILAPEPPGNVSLEVEEFYAMIELARCALAAGDRAAAEDMAERCEHMAARMDGLKLAAALARRCRGLVDGDPAPLADAVAYFRTVSRPLAFGHTLEDLAVVRAACGDTAGGQAALGEAAAIYARLGADWDLRRADTRLRPYGVRRRRAGVRRPQAGWEALTPTEVKVAFLVAEGLSNPEIGARLFLSRYTVQVHVSRILAKLQVRSRVEVVGYAAARELEPRRAVGQEIA